MHKLIIIIIIYYTLLTLHSTTSAQNPLLSFKNSLANPQLLNWTASQSQCNFNGITCNTENHITAITIQSIPLTLSILALTTSLLSIPTLQNLTLHSINLTGTLASAQCHGADLLAYLDLSNNQLTGSVSDVYDFSSSCPGLTSLNISGNSVGGFASSVHVGVGFSIEVLDLSYNKIVSESELRWLFSGLGRLRHLDLAGNGLVSGGLPGFANCSALEYLDLSNNRLSGEIGEGVFGSCSGLVHLNISSNHFAGIVPADVSNCTLLAVFSLANNNFSGEFLGDSLALMHGLKIVEFAFNGFNGSLGDSIAKLTMLQVLDLSSNKLTGWIPSTLCPRPGFPLRELYLQNNMISGAIPESLSNCTSLVYLDLSLNLISGSIPPSLGSLTDLRDLIMWQNNLEGEIPVELANIRTLENLILDNNGLTGTIPTEFSSCINLNWISLSSNHLTGSIPGWIGQLKSLAILKLGNNSFSGSIPSVLGDCKSLIWLDLNNNKLNGSIPSALAKQSGKIAGGLVAGKRYVYLRNNGSAECRGSGNLLEFAGIRPEDLNRLPSRQFCNFTRIYIGSTQYTFHNNGSMLFLDLSYNQLSGEIPGELGDMYNLLIMNLGHNFLSGPIPSDFGKLRFVAVMDLSHNELAGPIPGSLAGLAMLTEIDLSNNKLNGSIPQQGQFPTFPRYQFENNSGLCGFPLSPCGDSSLNLNNQNQKSHRRQASLVGSIAMGLLFSLFCIFGLVIILVEHRKRQKRKENDNNSRDIYIDSRSHSGTDNSNWKFTYTHTVVINLATFDTFDKPLKNLTLGDLVEATNGFHNDAMIGSGGFGDVYKAHLKDGSVVAIKKLKHVSGQGDREFMAEMETIGKIKHRNLVPLLGYCKAGEERLLVYEYMKYGSLEDVLHNRKKTGMKLNWAARRKIAIGSARGLAFLHHNCIPHIIHRDMKSSNVLLDENLEARVSDFGMARLMNSVDTHLSVSTLAGTPGYVPPEYYQSFRCTTKGDVYSYGVVLLELLTGRPSTDSSDFGDNNLVGWVKQHYKVKISDVFDPELLKEDPSLELELLEHLKIACACLDDRPMRRPTMVKVMAMFKELQAGSTLDSKASAGAASVGDDMILKEGKEEKD